MSIEKVFGIDAKRIYALNRLSDDAAVTAGMVRLFAEYGYDVTMGVDTEDLRPSVQYHGNIVRIATNLPIANSLVRFSHLQVNLVDAETGGMVNEHPATITPGQLFVDIPGRAFGGKELKAKVIVWGERINPTEQEERSVVLAFDWTEKVQMTKEVSESSTLQEHLKTILQTVVPFDKSAGTWHMTIGSWHHVEGGAPEAIDFNLSTGGDKDYGKAVYAIAKGTVDQEPNVSIGEIVLRHETEINGVMTTWKTRYLHLPLEKDLDGSIVVRVRKDMKPDGEILYEKKIAMGDNFDAEQQFAATGKNGTDWAHLHFQAEDVDGKGIALEQIFTEMGMRAFAEFEDAIPDPANANLLTKRVEVTWNPAEQGWIIPTFNILFSRKAHGTGLDNVWVALAADETRERVIRTHQLSDGRTVDAWLKAGNFSQEWNSQTLAWESF